MKVLHVNAKAGFFGGVERILFDTATGLRERGWHQYLLHTGENEGEDFRAPFTRVMTDLDEALTLQPDVALIHKEADPRRIATLAKAVPTVRMVHDHDLVCLRRHKYFPRNTRICTLPAGMNCYTNGCFIQRSSPGSLLPITFKGLGGIVQGLAAHEQVRHFIAISRFMREELEMNGIPAERIELIHPIPRALDSVKAVSPPPTDGAAEILFVGQVIRGKGADLMIRALAHLQDDWHATIVGDGHHLGACRDLARELGIAERIEFTGWVDHEALGRFYERALCTVVPSRWPEPFGMVGVEAMARARPVVAFRAGGIPDWLDDGRTGHLVPEADTGAMAAAMAGLIHDRERAGAMGLQGRQTVDERFSHGHYLDAMMTLLSSATRSHGATP